MQGVNAPALRVAAAVPLAFEAYQLITYAVEAGNWSFLSTLIHVGVSLFPALVFGAACVLVLLGRGWRWLWLLLATTGLWLIVVDVWSWRGVEAPWRPGDEFAMGLYAMVLASAHLLGHTRVRPNKASSDSGRGTSR